MNELPHDLLRPCSADLGVGRNHHIAVGSAGCPGQRASPSPRTAAGARAARRRSRRRRSAGAAATGRDRHRDRRTRDPRKPPQVDRPAASIAPVLPAETTASARPSATARPRRPGRSRAWRAPPRRLLAISITVGRRPARASRCRGPAARTAPRRLPRAARRAHRRRSLRSAVSAHRVDRDAGHALGREAERLDLTALVGAAGRADAVSELGRVALGAGVDPGRSRRMRRPARVSTCLRGLSLGDRHGSGRHCSRRSLGLS